MPKPVDLEAQAFYRESMIQLRADKVPFLVGGRFAIQSYTGVEVPTKDFDLFVRPESLAQSLRSLERIGCRTEVPFINPMWLAKAFGKSQINPDKPPYIDIISRNSNGFCEVDEDWFKYSRDAILFDEPVKVIPPEEAIWSKMYVKSKDSYHGEDVRAVIKSMGSSLDWSRLLERVGNDWKTLLSELVLFKEIHPNNGTAIPEYIYRTLLLKALNEPLGIIDQNDSNRENDFSFLRTMKDRRA